MGQKKVLGFGWGGGGRKESVIPCDADVDDVANTGVKLILVLLCMPSHLCCNKPVS